MRRSQGGSPTARPRSSRAHLTLPSSPPAPPSKTKIAVSFIDTSNRIVPWPSSTALLPSRIMRSTGGHPQPSPTRGCAKQPVLPHLWRTMGRSPGRVAALSEIVTTTGCGEGTACPGAEAWQTASGHNLGKTFRRPTRRRSNHSLKSYATRDSVLRRCAEHASGVIRMTALSLYIVGTANGERLRLQDGTRSTGSRMRRAVPRSGRHDFRMCG
jgi:hypothetical protein